MLAPTPLPLYLSLQLLHLLPIELVMCFSRMPPAAGPTYDSMILDEYRYCMIPIDGDLEKKVSPNLDGDNTSTTILLSVAWLDARPGRGST